MIAYIFGRADNYDLIFEKNNAGQWQCTVPFERDGQYVVTLYAVDEAGNTSYYSKVLFAVDTKRLYVQIKSFNYFLEASDKKSRVLKLCDSRFFIKALDCDYSLAAAQKPYAAEILSCNLI
jgi:hypothetical protein